MGYTIISQFIDRLDITLKDSVGDQKIKGVSNSPANSDTTNGKELFEDAVRKGKYQIQMDILRLKYVREVHARIDVKNVLELG